MRQMQYLSPTSLAKYLEDRVSFYQMYLADTRPPRDPQTLPMCTGSAFDAYVKSYLHEKLFGKGYDPRFDLDALLESQVEPQNRDFARNAGKHIFEHYKKSGCLTDMMTELQGSVSQPRFEFDLMGVIDGRREGISTNLGTVPFLGKPDLYYINKSGASVIHDWKVNGYCSKYTTSPLRGYVRLRKDGINEGAHKDCIPNVIKGMLININLFLETVKEDWARQLAIYAWLCGENVGADFIASIDQVVCAPSTIRPEPDLRFAEHRCRISKPFQFKIFDIAQEAWRVITSDHYFQDQPIEISKQRCTDLDNHFSNISQITENDWHDKITRER